MFRTTGTATVDLTLYYSRFGNSDYGSTSSPKSWNINSILFFGLPTFQYSTTDKSEEKYYLSQKDFELLRQSIEESPKPSDVLVKLFNTHSSV